MSSYRTWKRQRFLSHDVRVSMSAVIVRRILRRDMIEDSSAVCIRDVAVVVLAFLFGLKELSILNMGADDMK